MMFLLGLIISYLIFTKSSKMNKVKYVNQHIINQISNPDTPLETITFKGPIYYVEGKLNDNEELNGAELLTYVFGENSERDKVFRKHVWVDLITILSGKKQADLATSTAFVYERFPLVRLLAKPFKKMLKKTDEDLSGLSDEAKIIHNTKNFGISLILILLFLFVSTTFLSSSLFKIINTDGFFEFEGIATEIVVTTDSNEVVWFKIDGHQRTYITKSKLEKMDIYIAEGETYSIKANERTYEIKDIKPLSSDSF